MLHLEHGQGIHGGLKLYTVAFSRPCAPVNSGSVPEQRSLGMYGLQAVQELWMLIELKAGYNEIPFQHHRFQAILPRAFTATCCCGAGRTEVFSTRPLHAG